MKQAVLKLSSNPKIQKIMRNTYNKFGSNGVLKKSSYNAPRTLQTPRRSVLVASKTSKKYYTKKLVKISTKRRRTWLNKARTKYSIKSADKKKTYYYKIDPKTKKAIRCSKPKSLVTKK